MGAQRASLVEAGRGGEGIRMKTLAIILCAGRGSRMGESRPKQYLELSGKPVISYSLHRFEESSVDDMFLVIGAGEEEYVRREILEKENFSKLRKLVEGGSERYISVYHALREAKDEYDIVLIHDGARPLVGSGLIESAIEGAREFGAYIPAVSSKDTVRLADEKGFFDPPLDRARLYLVQTPQAFDFALCRKAYDMLFASADREGITDDAAVLERMLGRKSRVGKGDYRNIKITTPEDMRIAEALLKETWKSL